jgi:fructokinase
MSTDQAVVIWGEVLWDRFPDGAKLGGAPANVAWHLGQAGGWAQLVTRIGDDDDGRAAVAQLDDFVDTSLVQVDGERATGEVQVVVEGGEPRYRLVPQRAWERIECTEAVAEAVGAAGLFVYGTLAQRTPEGHAGWRAAIRATGRSCLRVCDLNLRPSDHDVPAVREALDVADVVKLNDKEVAAIRDWLAWPDPIAELRKKPRVVAITHGAAGSTLHAPDSAPIEIPGVRAAAGGDNVGCGDAYLAILVHGMTLGWDLASSGRAASRWAAAVAGVRGATPRFSDEQVAEMLEMA